MPHLSQNGAFLLPVAEHEDAEYIMQIIGLETNTSGPCPPEEQANERGEIVIFIPSPSCAEKSLSGFLLFHAAATLPRLPLRSCFPFFRLSWLLFLCLFFLRKFYHCGSAINSENRQPAVLTKLRCRLTPLHRSGKICRD